MGKESGGDSAEVLGEAFFKERKAELEQRVSKKRFIHVMGVVEEAEILARAYGVDVREARLAGLCTTGTRPTMTRRFASASASWGFR